MLHGFEPDKAIEVLQIILSKKYGSNIKITKEERGSKIIKGVMENGKVGINATSKRSA